MSTTKQAARSALPRKLNVKQTQTRLSKTKKSVLALRKQLWPEVTDDMLWLRGDSKRKGFTTIPRTMPLFMELIADASKHVTQGQKSVPAGKAYLVLWCRVFDEGVVRIDSEAAAAREAGYVGERNVSTWREHMRVLKELGFIDYKPGLGGDFQNVLILSPYHALKKLKLDGRVQEAMFNAIFMRAAEIGATDLTDEEDETEEEDED